MHETKESQARVNTAESRGDCQAPSGGQSWPLVSGAGGAALARSAGIALLDWSVSPSIDTGRIGTATVRLPSGKIGAFAVYNLSRDFAEPFPTNWIRKVRGKREHRELMAAAPVVVELVKRFDPGSLKDGGRYKFNAAA